MKGRAQKLRLGIFLVVSMSILIGTVVFFTARSLLERSDDYYVSYSDVSVGGLEVGSPVKYMGIRVGSIADISIDPDDINNIVVRLSLERGTPIKEDAVADMVSMGITGLKTIEIRGGSNEAEFLEPGGYISPGSSMVEEITGRAEVIAYKVEGILNNLEVFTQPENFDKIINTIDKISNLSEQAEGAIEHIDEVIVENRADVKHTVQALRSMSGNLDNTTQELFLAIERFNLYMQSDTIGELLANVREITQSLKEAGMKELVEDLAIATRQTQVVLRNLDSEIDVSSRTLNENLLILKHTLENLNEASRKINTNPSILLRGRDAKDSPDSKFD